MQDLLGSPAEEVHLVLKRDDPSSLRNSTIAHLLGLPMLVQDNSSIALSSHKRTVQSSDRSPLSTDVDFFTSQLERPLSTNPMEVQFETTSLLTNAAMALDTTKNKIARDLSRLSKHIDREALRKYPNDLSNALLMSNLLVKTLGKTTQCIDKICNLQ